MADDKETLRTIILSDKDDIIKKLISGGLSDKETMLYTEFLRRLNKYIEICEKRGRY